MSVAIRFARQPAAMASLLFLLALGVLALLAPWLYPQTPWAMVAPPLQPPLASRQWPLGTDLLGRDPLAGLLFGARVSLGIGLLTLFSTLSLGVLAGALAGYFGGWLDSVLMRLSDIFQVIPGLFLAVILVAILEPSTFSLVLALTLAAWPPVARIVRSEFLALRQREFVLAARTAGLGPWHIAFVEILPNALPAVLALAGLVMATAILGESALSFLGLGDPEAMSWGTMIDGARNLARQAWWLSLWPGLAILFTVLAVHQVGEGLRVACNVRERGVA
ncbi:ABC transporter permease [Stutzerimonas kirkiae]|uniref:ABC transporter permease n=1 Tax=Stutzerimonas kirkiae TaxID=2211392 RepID=A0A4V2KBP5_9GAMM|nr:ABC transporter permease [Stutzerimonas kirkiae]TBU87988.1 ABC transporter permease [Stutzerimonas kirkiae]TBU98188.1 ABC transporter permease [Stutzerimonas kirkiae]TBV10504.1 ABC transporter permease [Stutzerimonas kirkiae]TBV13940.1 ABC transporter permease [Stutzerimonas kirkiae]